MIREIDMGSDVSVLDDAETNGLGRFVFYHPAGTFALTPASRILIEAITQHQAMLHGIGLDWGSGVGCLAILASRVGSVESVIGLEISQNNVSTAVRNAEANNATQKTQFYLSDSYAPLHEQDRLRLEALKGKIGFILSNPPSSDWDDGFGFRRIVMSGAGEYLQPGGLVLLNISFQYGAERTGALTRASEDFSYLGVAASTGWVPFDLHRQDLLDCLEVYARVEAGGGADYTFLEDAQNDESRLINARKALDNYRERGVSPMTKWQTHLFRLKSNHGDLIPNPNTGYT